MVAPTVLLDLDAPERVNRAIDKLHLKHSAKRAFGDAHLAAKKPGDHMNGDHAKNHQDRKRQQQHPKQRASLRSGTARRSAALLAIEAGGAQR